MKQIQSPKEKSNRTKALEMYHQGYNTYQVATELDIPAEEAERYQLEYWKLIGMNELAELYGDNRDSIKSVINLHYELDARGTTVKQVFEYSKKLDSVRNLDAKKQTIIESIGFYQYQLDHLRQQQLVAGNQLKSLQGSIITLQRANGRLVDENQFLLEENQRYRFPLNAVMSSDGYEKIRKIAHSEITTVMKFDSLLVPAVAASVVKALTTYPQLQSLLSYPYAWQEIFRVGSNPNLPTTESQLLEESRNLYYQTKKYFIRSAEGNTIDTLSRNYNGPVYS